MYYYLKSDVSKYCSHNSIVKEKVNKIMQIAKINIRGAKIIKIKIIKIFSRNGV